MHRKFFNKAFFFVDTKKPYGTEKYLEHTFSIICTFKIDFQVNNW